MIGFGLFFVYGLCWLRSLVTSELCLLVKPLVGLKWPHLSVQVKRWKGYSGVGCLCRHGCPYPWLAQEHFSHLFDFGTITFSSSQGALWGLVIAIVSVIGDLIASVLKRLAGMKDSGGAIPGIGGLLDLTDSLILSAPTGYFIILLL